jgi:hypothetical protein
VRASPLRLALVAAAALAAALGATRLLGPRAADDAPDADAARRARIAAELRGAARDGAAGADGAPLAFPSAAEEGSLEARDGAERLFATASARPGRRGGGEGASARADGGAARAGPEPGAGPASSARGATVSALAHEPGRDDGAAAALAASGKGTVVGRVALASGDPAAGARVEVGDLRPDHGGAAATADDGGAFAVACDPGLSWLLASSAAPATRSALLEVRVVAGETTDLGIVLLDAPGAIEGVVRDRGGSPAPGVDVRVRVGEAVRPATTASDGRFAFPGVPAGRFLVHADAVPGEEGGVTVGVEVKPGATSEVTLGGSPQITGVLLGPLGAPAPSGDRGIAIVDMAAMRSANTADLLRAFVGAGGRFVPTDEQGRFAVGGLPPGATSSARSGRSRPRASSRARPRRSRSSSSRASSARASRRRPASHFRTRRPRSWSSATTSWTRASRRRSSCSRRSRARARSSRPPAAPRRSCRSRASTASSAAGPSSRPSASSRRRRPTPPPTSSSRSAPRRGP